MIRNLLYNCCPFAGNEEWRMNVDRLNRYASVFNGRRIVLLKTGEGLHPPEVAKQAFNFDAEFIEVQNNPVLGEVEGFIDALGLLESLDPNEITFYAHTKGTTRAGEPEKIVNVRLWRNRMYEGCLENIEAVDSVMQHYACSGCFVLTQGNLCDKLNVPFFFAGTFFWLNHAKLFSKDWRKIHIDRHGVEAYPGVQFLPEESYCFTPPAHPQGGQLYAQWSKYSWMAEHTMIWSESAKLLFLHNHKTAGCSVWQTLKTILPDLRLEQLFLYPVAPADGCLRRKLDLEGFFNGYRIVGFVRNPWDRLVSFYSMLDARTLKNMHNTVPHKPEYHRYFAQYGTSFDAFLQHVVTHVAPDGSSLGRSQLDTYFADKDGRLVTDQLYRFENAQADFARLLSELNLPATPLQHIHPSKHEHYSAYYTDETRDLVARLFRRDIDTFGYTFERKTPYREHKRDFDVAAAKHNTVSAQARQEYLDRKALREATRTLGWPFFNK